MRRRCPQSFRRTTRGVGGGSVRRPTGRSAHQWTPIEFDGFSIAHGAPPRSTSYNSHNTRAMISSAVCCCGRSGLFRSWLIGLVLYMAISWCGEVGRNICDGVCWVRDQHEKPQHKAEWCLPRATTTQNTLLRDAYFNLWCVVPISILISIHKTNSSNSWLID